MSIKAWDGNIDAISYLFHENPEAELFLNYKIPDETIQKARSRNNEVQDKVAKAKERASWKIEEELLEHYRQRHTTEECRAQQNLTEWEIAKDIILYALRRDKYIPNDFLLKGMARKIQFKLLNGDLNDEEDFAERLVSSAYRMDYDQEQEWRRNLPPRGGPSCVPVLEKHVPPKSKEVPLAPPSQRLESFLTRKT